MKFLKRLFTAILFSLISLLIFNFVRSIDSEFILGTNKMINVVENKKLYKKETIEKNITDFAKKENVSIVYSIPDISNREPTKNVYFFKGGQHIEVGSFNTKSKQVILSREAYLTKDLKGKYFFSRDVSDKKIADFFESNGLRIDIFQISYVNLFIQYIVDNNLEITLLSSILIFIVMSFYDIVNKFKEHSIKALHGHSFLKNYFKDCLEEKIFWLSPSFFIGIPSIFILKILGVQNHLIIYGKLLAVTYSVIIFILLIIDFFSYALYNFIDIAHMIKGKKPYFFLTCFNTIFKIILIVLTGIIVMQNLKLIDSLKTITSSSSLWKQVDDYYLLEISPNLNGEQEMNVLANKLKNFTLDEEKNGAILIQNNHIATPKQDNYDPYEGNVLYVNHNFISLYQKLSHQLSFLSSKDKNTIYLPKEALASKNEVENNFQNWFNVKQINNEKMSFELKSIAHDYNVFSFDTRSSKKFTFDKNPIIVTADSSILDPDYFLATISQGSYLFKNIESINSNIIRYDLTNDISGITNFKDSASYEINRIQIKINALMVSLILLISIMLLISGLNIKYYYEKNKKEIFIKMILGYSSYKINRLILIMNSVLVVFSGVLLYVLTYSKLSFIIIFILLLLDLFVVMLSAQKLKMAIFNKSKEINI